MHKNCSILNAPWCAHNRLHVLWGKQYLILRKAVGLWQPLDNITLWLLRQTGVCRCALRGATVIQKPCKLRWYYSSSVWAYEGFLTGHALLHTVFTNWHESFVSKQTDSPVCFYNCWTVNIHCSYINVVLLRKLFDGNVDQTICFGISRWAKRIIDKFTGLWKWPAR